MGKVSSSSFVKMVFLSPGQLFFVLIYSFVMVSSTTTLTNPTTDLTSASIPTFPSCLQPNISWAAEEMTSVTVNIDSPELCQSICQADPACIAITWTQESFPLYPLSCATFSSTKNATECVDCVSGPPVCLCSVPGECETSEDNVLEICDNGDFVDGQCLTPVAEDFGILVIGGYNAYTAQRSVEFWSPSDPEEGSCQLNTYPRQMTDPTANLVSSQLVACYYDSCEIYNGGGEWTHLSDTISTRDYFTSAVREDKILLIGGAHSRSTEWISVDGSPSQPGPFDVRHGYSHCTMQLSSDLILVTGGRDTYDYVTSYQLTGNGDETPLTPLNQGRADHACGVYQDADGQQVILVTGGYSSGPLGDELSSTEVAVYSSDGQLEWREVEGGELPSPRYGLTATLVGDILFVIGGRNGNSNVDSILSWDPVAESWQQAGNLAKKRLRPAAVAVPTSLVEC